MKTITSKETITLLLCGALGFFAITSNHYQLGPNQVLAKESAEKPSERYTELQTFTKILNFVQQFYVEPVDVKKLIYGAIKGMLRELDPHTNFLPPDIYKDFETETSGQFGGIGIEISIQNGILTVISPIEDTPAFEAGIKAGDKLVEINGTSTKGVSLVEASQLMKGDKGSKIRLKVVREDSDKVLDFQITRAVVKIKSVKPLDLGEGYHYVRVTSFIENTGKDLEKVLNEVAKKSDLKGLILDLRKNPGGLLDQAVYVSDLFLKQGDIVSTMGRDPASKKVESATKKGKYTEFPLIVLMNEHSASASEIVAGALQDNKRALIMGTKSFGKGSVQQIVKMGDGSGLKVTVARYYTPSGRSIQAEGITPDVEIEDFDLALAKQKAQGKLASLTREKDIAGHLLSEKEKLDKSKSKGFSPDGSLDKSTDKSTEKSTDSLSNKMGDKSSERSACWIDYGSKVAEAKSPREKLLATDYQAYQAYNYLRAWKTIKSMN